MCPEHVTQNRNDLTLDSNGKKHQHCFVVLQRIVRGKSKCLPFVVGIPLKLNKNIPHFSLTVLNANRRTFFFTTFKENTHLYLWQNHRAWTSHHIINNSLTKLYIIAQSWDLSQFSDQRTTFHFFAQQSVIHSQLRGSWGINDHNLVTISRYLTL